jgi:hypothetical protein
MTPITAMRIDAGIMAEGAFPNAATPVFANGVKSEND